MKSAKQSYIVLHHVSVVERNEHSRKLLSYANMSDRDAQSGAYAVPTNIKNALLNN